MYQGYELATESNDTGSVPTSRYGTRAAVEVT